MSSTPFILLTNIIKQGGGEEKSIQSTSWESNKTADPLLGNKDQYSCEFITCDFSYKIHDGDTSMNDPIPYSGEEGPRFYTSTGVLNGQGEAQEVDFGWKLEAVKGYVQNEKEQVTGWWKNSTFNRASDFAVAHIDLI